MIVIYMYIAPGQGQTTPGFNFFHKSQFGHSHSMICNSFPPSNGERGGLVVNASDSRSRGRGFEPHSGQTVLCP